MSARLHLHRTILSSDRAVLEYLSLREGTYRTIAEALARSLGTRVRCHPSTIAVLTRLHGRALVTCLPDHSWGITKAGREALAGASVRDRSRRSAVEKVRRVAKRERS